MTPSAAHAARPLSLELQALVQRPEWGITPIGIEGNRIHFGPVEAEAPPIKPYYDLLSANTLGTDVATPLPTCPPAPQRAVEPDLFALGARFLDRAMTTIHAFECSSGRIAPLPLLSKRSARELLTEPAAEAILADDVRQLRNRALSEATAPGMLFFLAATLLTRADPRSYFSPNEVSTTFLIASRLLEMERHLGAAALAAEWGFATYADEPRRFHCGSDSARVWAECLADAAAHPSLAAAFHHGLTFAFRADDRQAACMILSALASWHARQKQWLDAGRCSVRAAALLSSLEAEGDHDERFVAAGVQGQLESARRAFMRAAEGGELCEALAPLLLEARALAG